MKTLVERSAMVERAARAMSSLVKSDVVHVHHGSMSLTMVVPNVRLDDPGDVGPMFPRHLMISIGIGMIAIPVEEIEEVEIHDQAVVVSARGVRTMVETIAPLATARGRATRSPGRSSRER